MFLRTLEKSVSFWFLLSASVVFFFLRLPSFFEPYWYGDEGVYEVLGYAMRHGRLLYQGIWDNKPPLLYLVYAVFNGNQMYVRMFSFLVGLVAIYVFFALAKRLSAQKNTYIATGFFALFLGLPLLEGNIANAENFMILPIVISAYLIVKSIQDKKYIFLNLFLAGCILGISFLIKVVAVFDFAAFFLIFFCAFFAFTRKSLLKVSTSLLNFAVGFCIPLAVTVGFFAYKGILTTFIQSAFLTNVGYVNFGNKLLIPFTTIVVPQGFLLVKLFALACLTLFLFLKRKKISLPHLFIYFWLSYSLFNAFFSQRPYTHYVLVLLPGLALLVGMLAEKKWRIFHALLFASIVVLLSVNFWFYGKTVFYYQNFFQFITNQKSLTDYQAFFDKGVPRDYAVVEFLKQNVLPNDTVFLWTNSAQMYYLLKHLPLGRYTVAYHMTLSPATLSETASVLAAKNPRFIVLMPNASSFPFPAREYRLVVDIQGGLIYERIF